MSTAATTSPWVELAARSAGTTEVILLWSRTSGRLWVVVLDIGSGETFVLDARRDNALHVFYHPYAYR
ncbi:MAG: hypothetical protein JOZ56_04490 [Actinobacteria bacterium]|nr:hypothetical protein [Actinomycetota bacterium]MBV8562326.1 hypothetical protein [Actinomycetota bacterium]